MPHSLLRQTTTAVIRDFDKTRIPGYMETPIFGHLDVDGDRFWREVDGRPAFYRERGLEIVSRDSLYLSHMPTLRAARAVPRTQRRAGARVRRRARVPSGALGFFPLLGDELARRAEYADVEIGPEHYIVGSGLREVILGRATTPQVHGV